MKKLNQFVEVQVDRMISNMRLMVMKSEVLKDFESGNLVGAKYTIIVWKDSNDYGDEGISNAGETFSVKVLNKDPKTVDQPTYVKLVNPTAVIFGEYRNQLSVTATDVIFSNNTKDN